MHAPENIPYIYTPCIDTLSLSLSLSLTQNLSLIINVICTESGVATRTHPSTPPPNLSLIKPTGSVVAAGNGPATGPPSLSLILTLILIAYDVLSMT